MATNPQALGKIMMVGGLILGLALLTFFFNGVLDEQRNPNRNVETLMQDGAREVALKRARNGHFVVTGRINGEPVELLLDTGATTVSIPESLAKRLDLRRGRAMPTRTANGVITTYATELARVAIGDIEVRDVRASINPHSDLVLLGMSFLRDLEINQRGDTLTLRQH